MQPYTTSVNFCYFNKVMWNFWSLICYLLLLTFVVDTSVISTSTSMSFLFSLLSFKYILSDKSFVWISIVQIICVLEMTPIIICCLKFFQP